MIHVLILLCGNASSDPRWGELDCLPYLFRLCLNGEAQLKFATAFSFSIDVH
jgi:hypothetical protein